MGKYWKRSGAAGAGGGGAGQGAEVIYTLYIKFCAGTGTGALHKLSLFPLCLSVARHEHEWNTRKDDDLYMIYISMKEEKHGAETHAAECDGVVPVVGTGKNSTSNGGPYEPGDACYEGTQPNSDSSKRGQRANFYMKSSDKCVLTRFQMRPGHR